MRIYLAVILGTLMAGSILTAYAEDKPAAMTAETTVATAQSAYVCPDCQTMAMKAGKCSMCQKDKKEMHLLGVKDGKAMLCDCAADCKCDAKGMKDGKCSCGKDVKTMSCTGMYGCACPGGKCCNTISDKPGKCACGMDMKKTK